MNIKWHKYYLATLFVVLCLFVFVCSLTYGLLLFHTASQRNCAIITGLLNVKNCIFLVVGSLIIIIGSIIMH